MERKDCGYKIVLLLFLILFGFNLFSKFITNEEKGKIIVKYFPEENDTTKILILPPSDINVKVNPSGFEKLVMGTPFYFKDFHILPLKPFKEKYEVLITYNPVKYKGRIVKPDETTLKILRGITINEADLLKNIKPRSVNEKKFEYDGTPLFKIKISKSGLYRVFYDDIVNKTGIVLSSYDPNCFKLYNKNVEIPLNFYGTGDGIFGNGDFFEFYGERKSGENTYYDKYQLDNVYVFVVGGKNGIRYVFDGEFFYDTLLDSTISSFQKTTHIEEDSFYSPLGGRTTIDTSDLWFMSTINSSDPYSFDLSFLNRDTTYNKFYFSSLFHGFSYNLLINPDHVVGLYINDSLYDTIRWDDLSSYLYINDTIDLFLDTINIKLKVIGGDSLSLGLNFIEYGYFEQLIMENGKLDFDISNISFGKYKFHIKGLHSSDVKIYRKDLKLLTNFVTVFNSLEGNYDLYFTDEIFTTPVHYSVYQNSNFLVPDTMETFKNVLLQNSSNEGNYIIIVDQKLKDKASQLATLFSSKNKVFVAGTEEIYDEFNYGFRGVKPIKDFIVAAYNNWQVPPSHILLLGDGTPDNNNHLKLFDYGIPAPYYYENSAYSPALIASDNYYAAIVGDDPVEDVSISRFPIRSEFEIDIAINKVKHFIDWKNSGIFNLKFIFGYDTTPPGLGLPSYVDAKYQSLKLANMLPEYIGVDFMANLYDNNGDFINQLDYGASILNIYAHGASQSIGSGVYLRKTDILRMNNINRLPFVKVYSCDTGYYDEIYREEQSIGETFVLAPFGGSIAYYGSATASTDNLNNALGESNFRQLAYNGIKNIGEMILYGELMFFVNSSVFGTGNVDDPNVYEIKNYGLLGVNFIDLKIPDISYSNSCSLSTYTISPKDTLTIFCSDSNLKDGFLQTVMLDDERRMLSFDNSNLTNGFGENTLIIPDTLKNSSVVISTVAYTQDTSLLYLSYPSVNSDGIKNFYILPSLPDTLESFKIYAKKGGKNIKNITAYYKYPNSTSYNSFVMLKDTVDTTLYYTASLAPIKAKKSFYDYFSYYIYYTDTLETFSFTTPVKKILIPPYPDVRIYQNPYLSFKDDAPALTVKISNAGERKSTDLLVSFFVIDENDDTLLIGVDTVDLESGETKESKIKIDKNYFQKKIFIYAAKDTLNFPDRNFSNNKIFDTSFDNIYSYIYGSPMVDSLLTYYNFNIVNEGQQNQDTNLMILSREESVITSQSLEILSEDENNLLYRIRVLKPELNSRVKLFPDPDFHPSFILRYDSLSNNYIFVSNEKSDTVYYTLNNYSDRFIIGRWNDTIPPEIKIFVENKEIFSKTILLNSIDFGITIEDDEGIDIGSIKIVVDGDTLSKDEYKTSDQTVLKTIPIKLNRYLDNGDHKLEVFCNDIYANSSSQIYEFQVSNQFRIINLANFPNPVTGGRTKIVCEFSKDPENSIVKIYTSSGKLFKEYELTYLKDRFYSIDLQMSDFQNGTYFYVVEAIKDNERIRSKVQKMSLLK